MTVDVLAADPGLSTGLAWTTEDGKIETTVAPTAEAVARVIGELRPKTVVIEWFITGQRLNEYSRETIERCGGIEMVAFLIGARVVRHIPKTRLPYLDEAAAALTARYGPRGTTIKGAGVWTDHQQDAYAHVLAHLRGAPPAVGNRTITTGRLLPKSNTTKSVVMVPSRPPRRTPTQSPGTLPPRSTGRRSAKAAPPRGSRGSAPTRTKRS